MENILGTNLDRIVILAYFAIVMGFGAYFGKYSKTTSDYFFIRNFYYSHKLRTVEVILKKTKK